MADQKLPNENEIVTDADFSFVQKDESIYDKKFQTRPTTYFKDAMKRFVKNKSSVAAAAILATLIMMAIIVPIADRNNIEDNVVETQYLPPKWFDGDMNGFMDGTGRVDNIVLDPFEKDEKGNYILPEDSSYIQNAVVGEIEPRSSFSNTLTEGVKKYGKNGEIAMANMGSTNRDTLEWKATGPAGIASSTVSFDKSETVSYTIEFDYEKTKETFVDGGELSVYLAFEPSEGENESYRLTDSVKISTLNEATPIVASNVVGSLKSIGYERETYSGKFQVLIEEPSDVKYTFERFYLKSATAKAETSDVSAASFNNATKTLADLEDRVENSFTRVGDGQLGIHNSEVVYGSFRYDYYKAVFGSTDDNDPKPVFLSRTYSDYEIDTFIKLGWMNYVWGEGDEVGEFTLTEVGKEKCPIRGITSQRFEEDPFHEGDPEYEIKEVTAKVSYFRQLAYDGKIANYASPKYVFGTNSRGVDFFKVVFSGLLVSLGLGFLSAAINIIIGLIWGAVAGYFGGWVDLLMERFVEILGGMPWIVMMTLIVLLTGSNNFGIFLLALCITGWIGISGITRSQFYRYKRREYVLASRTLGASDARLIFRHILPNAIGTIVTSAVLMIPSVIFTEANIAYLLPGTMQLSGSFGVTLSDVQKDLTLYPYLIVSASIVMALIMISFNLFGNGLRDAFNPSLKGSDE